MRLKAKKTKLTKLDKGILILNCLAVFALLVSYCAPFINPETFWPPAFFSMGYIPILFINAVFIIIWILRMRKQALISAIAILLGCVLMVKNIGFHTKRFETGKASPSLIRVMTYNVYNFLNQSPDINTNTDSPILQLVKQEQPDILNMQEFFTHNQDSYNMVDSVKRALGSNHYWFKVFKITPYDSTGLALFSKYPIINRDTIPQVNGITTEGIYVDVKKDSKIIRVYNLHLQSTQFDREENAYLEDLPHTAHPSLHHSRHIGGKLELAFKLRALQVIGLKQFISKSPYPYIITGDFNDTPLSFAVNHMAADLKNAFREKGYGFGATWYGEYPGFQLDYIFTTPNFNITNYKILREKLSDHYPVLSDIQLK